MQHLTHNRIDPVARVTISTIQRVYSILRGEPVPVEYNPDVPPETFDVVIVDECHRSIYWLWRQVLDYFDAFQIGLTAWSTAIARPPHQWTPEKLWAEYEQLDRSRVRGSSARVLTDLVSLVRVALHQEDELVPYPGLVRERFHAWLLSQENAGRTFTGEQLAWLERIRHHIATAVAIGPEDSSFSPFVQAGGLGSAVQIFGDDLGPLREELNEVLAA